MGNSKVGKINYRWFSISSARDPIFYMFQFDISIRIRQILVKRIDKQSLQQNEFENNPTPLISHKNLWKLQNYHEKRKNVIVNIQNLPPPQSGRNLWTFPCYEAIQ